LDSLFGSIASTAAPVDRDSPLNVGLNFCVPDHQQAILAASDYLSFCLAGEHYIAVRSAQPALAESIARGLRSGAADEKEDRKFTVSGLLRHLRDVGSVRQDEMRAGWISENAGDLLIAAYPEKRVNQIKERPVERPKPPIGPRTTGSPLLDDSVKFTAYRPAILIPGKWSRMTIFMHPDEASTLIEIETRARQILSAEYEDYSDVVDSRFPIIRESEITLVPDVPGIRFNPPRRSFSWAGSEKAHEESFFMRAPFALAGKLARGRMSIFFGQLLLAEIVLNLGVAKEPTLKEQSWSKGVAKRFHKVFASYSNKDAKLVEAMESQIRTIGYDYLREIVRLRGDLQWNQRLLPMMADADIFQLFWSRNSAQSAEVETEWRHAVALQRDAFVRPAYWEIPMPEAPEPLRRLRFYYLPGIPRMADLRRERDAGKTGLPAKDHRPPASQSGAPAAVAPPDSSASTISQISAARQAEGTEHLAVRDQASSGKMSEPPPAKALAATPLPQNKSRQRFPRTNVFAVIGGCLFIFFALILTANLGSPTFVNITYPFRYLFATPTPSPTPTVQPTPAAIPESPVLLAPAPIPTPVETPTPIPTVEQPTVTPSVAPSSTPSPGKNDSEGQKNRRSRQQGHHRKHPVKQDQGSGE
ncbi:MAG TPA: TIR domain-containing protein, partial [Chthoniobacterales bacterium]|nr:TIR domain-containing protein [Chthoniobacterales bacterium]